MMGVLTPPIRSWHWYHCGENAISTGTEKALDDFVEDDIVRATVRVTGSHDYGTPNGGSTTAPGFKVLKIQRIGRDDSWSACGRKVCPSPA